MSQINIIASRIKNTRKTRGITQGQLAEAIGVSRSTVSSWEAGLRKPNALEFCNICEYFCISSDYLCGRADSCNTVNIPKIYNIDVNRLNALGKSIFFEFFDFLSANEKFKR